jgi:hypothetical protein
VNLTQPTCLLPTGIIVIVASGGGTLEYSIDNGMTYQLSSLFANLAAGSYNVKVRFQSDPDCVATYAGNPAILNDPANCCPLTRAVNDNPIPSGTYEAQLEITSTGTVANGGNVLFKADQSIELQPGFEVMLGGIFEVVMEGCVP